MSGRWRFLSKDKDTVAGTRVLQPNFTKSSLENNFFLQVSVCKGVYSKKYKRFRRNAKLPQYFFTQQTAFVKRSKLDTYNVMTSSQQPYKPKW